MPMLDEHMARIRALVGPVGPDQLRHVDGFLAGPMGLFVPILGQCGYAIRPSHTHPSYMAIVMADTEILNGKGFPPLAKERHRSGFQLRVLAPDVPHQELPSDASTRYYALFIEPQVLESTLAGYGTDPAQLASWRSFEASPRLMMLLRELMSECEFSPEPESPPRLALASLILHEIARADLESKPTGAMAGTTVRPAIEFIEHCYADAVTVADLAALCRMAPSTFARCFRVETGRTPMRYLADTRTRRASALLRLGTPIAEAAYMTGFSSASHLSGVFRKTMGISPREYQRRYLIR